MVNHHQLSPLLLHSRIACVHAVRFLNAFLHAGGIRQMILLLEVGRDEHIHTLVMDCFEAWARAHEAILPLLRTPDGFDIHSNVVLTPLHTAYLMISSLFLHSLPDDSGVTHASSALVFHPHSFSLCFSRHLIRCTAISLTAFEC